MTEPHVTDYSPGRWAVFGRARAFHAGVIVKNYDGAVVVDLGGQLTRVKKDRLAAALAVQAVAAELADDLNQIERRYDERRAGVHDWQRGAFNAAVADARRADAA